MSGLNQNYVSDVHVPAILGFSEDWLRNFVNWEGKLSSQNLIPFAYKSRDYGTFHQWNGIPEILMGY